MKKKVTKKKRAKKREPTYGEIVRKLSNLRSRSEGAEVEFLLALVETEENWLHILLNNGHDSFIAFLKAHHFCSVIRWNTFRLGLQHITREQARKIGDKSVLALAKTVNPANVPEFVESVLLWKEDHGGVCPSRQTAEKMLKEVDPRKEVPRFSPLAEENERLRKENKRLKAELAAARKQITRLKKTIERLKS
jgi:hypothetical protein